MSDKKDSPDGKESSEDSKDNVIRFPVERLKQQRRLKKLAGRVNDKRKTTLFLSLLSVLVMSAYLLQNIESQNVERNIANTPDNRDPSKDQVLADKVKDPKLRTPASYGRGPSAEDRLERIDLGTRYKMTRENGMFSSIQLREDGGMLDEPIYLEHRYNDGPAEFLMVYRDLISPGYDGVEEDPSGGAIDTRSFRLLRNGETVGFAVFKFDRPGRFLWMKVQSSN